MEKVLINTEYINLMQFLKLANIVMSGGEVKMLVDQAMVTVNGKIETRYRRKLYPGDQVIVDDQIELVVVNDNKEN
ncbi:MAG: RNA-binding S4 domain-containing protein [Clostridia bacterium]